MRSLFGRSSSRGIFNGLWTRQQSRRSQQADPREHAAAEQGTPPSPESDVHTGSPRRVTDFPDGRDLIQSSWQSLQLADDPDDMYLGFVPLGKDWALDIVGLPHNAARREIKGLYYSMAGIEKGDPAVLAMAREWFAWVADFIEDVFAIEEIVTFGWLRRAGVELPESMSTTQRAIKAGRARKICADVLAALADDASGSDVRAATDRLANVVLSHFATVESVVPQLLRGAYDASAKDHIVEVMATSLARSKPESFVLLARGFCDARLQRNFARVYGRGEDRAAFTSRAQAFEDAHVGAVGAMMLRGRAGSACGDSEEEPAAEHAAAAAAVDAR